MPIYDVIKLPTRCDIVSYIQSVILLPKLVGGEIASYMGFVIFLPITKYSSCDISS